MRNFAVVKQGGGERDTQIEEGCGGRTGTRMLMLTDEEKEAGEEQEEEEEECERWGEKEKGKRGILRVAETSPSVMDTTAVDVGNF